jgi:hypothetical protein
MPTEERVVKGVERCANHPSRLTVATCELCGRPLCVECAVPVRGRVLGIECLSEALGEDTPTSPPLRTWRRHRSPIDRVIGASLAVATLVTLLPWTRFGTGSGFAGGWAIDRRWSMLAACGAVLTFVAWLGLGRRATVARTVAIMAGALIGAGALLAALNPPPFTKPALAPWIALAAGVVATAAGFRARISSTVSHV